LQRITDYEQICNLQSTIQQEVAMNRDEQEDTTIYKVVVNDEEQYSIWPADRENALGWRDAGKTGPKAECLDYIKEVWTDMRPLSLRKKMEEDERRRAEGGGG
jgi:MbtH protein